jgi:hypothetical protein
MARPHDDDLVGLRQLFLDGVAVVGAAHQLPVPPDRKALCLELLGKQRHGLAILAGIGNENATRHLAFPQSPG